MVQSSVLNALLNSSKKKVRYWSDKESFLVGDSFYIFPVDHGSDFVTNTKGALTSKVLSIFSNGIFETENSIYIPYTKEVTK